MVNIWLSCVNFKILLLDFLFHHNDTNSVAGDIMLTVY